MDACALARRGPVRFALPPPAPLFMPSEPCKGGRSHRQVGPQRALACAADLDDRPGHPTVRLHELECPNTVPRTPRTHRVSHSNKGGICASGCKLCQGACTCCVPQPPAECCVGRLTAWLQICCPCRWLVQLSSLHPRSHSQCSVLRRESSRQQAARGWNHGPAG